VPDGDAPVEADGVCEFVCDGERVCVAVPVPELLGVCDADAPVDTDAVGLGATVPDSDIVSEGDRDGDAVMDAEAAGERVMDADAPTETEAGIDGDAETVLVVDCDGAVVRVEVPVRVPERVMVGVPVCVAVDETVGSAVAEGVGLLRSISEQIPAPNVLLHDQPYGLLYMGGGSGTSAGTSEHEVGNGVLGMVHADVQHVVSAVVGSIPAPENPLVVVHS